LSACISASEEYLAAKAADLKAAIRFAETNRGNS
jgi:hypothetical protein